MNINAINVKLEELNNNQLGLMAHAVVGYPTTKKSLEIIRTLISEGCDFLELQIPFSDPIADGETIMRACEIALTNGMDTDKAFKLVGRLNRNTNIPILFMAYYNTVFRYGVERFCKYASKLRILGLIIPDIPPEEEKSENYIGTCLKYNLYPIRVVSPSSSNNRLKINSKYAKGFIYCVSHFGVTGTKVTIDRELINYIKRMRKEIKLPVAVGFGLENKEQIQKLKRIAEIAIVGSAIIKNYDKGGIKSVGAFIQSLKSVLMYEK